MCGIAGIFNFSDTKINPEIANIMGASLEHRGPDFSDIQFIKNNVVFIHTRLAIIDLDKRSNQPFKSNDERFTIVFNGEIYNFKEIRKELENLGFKFRTTGDTEVLLNGYIEFGEQILHKLRGQFAFAIFDSLENTVFLARDRVGIKPLYYSLNEETLIFSSELKTIEQSGTIDFEPNYDSYVAYMRHLCVPGDQTGNKNIFKLEPGQYALINNEAKIYKKTYWDPFQIQINNDLTEDEAIKSVEDLLIQSVEYRKVSDVEVGLFLSGGLDSSLIGKLMKENDESKIKSFNIDYEDHFEGYQGEVEEARFAASEIGVELVEDRISFHDFKQIIDNYSFYQDDLVGDEVGIPLYFLGRASKKNGIKVIQVGEGADELFYGYDHWLRFMKLNKIIRPLTSKRNFSFTFKNHRSNLVSNILLNRTSFPGGALGFNIPEINKLVSSGISDEFSLIHHVDNMWDQYFSNKNAKLSKWMTLVDLKIRLPELLLMRMDKLVMQSSIEARVPFLDHELVEFVLSIPEDIIFRVNETKPLLKKVANKHISEKIFNRPKQGFRAPVGEWIKKDQNYFYDVVYEFNKSTNLLNGKYLETILKGNDYQKKWYLSNLANWHLNRSGN